jgi:hypothetical protein
MSENVTTEPSKSARKERAAFLVAEDKLSDELIAAEVGITPRTLFRWKSDEPFRARVEQIIEETRQALLARGILDKQNRLAGLAERHRKMAEVISQRAESLADVPGGGNTGLLVRQVKSIGRGGDFQVVEEYAVDTALLREMRETEKQAAVELGEWQERSTMLNVDLSQCNEDELERIANGEDPAVVLASSRRGRA